MRRLAVDTEHSPRRPACLAPQPAVCAPADAVFDRLLPLGQLGVTAGLIGAWIVAAWISHFFLTQRGYVDYVDGLVLFHQTQAAAGYNIYDPSYRQAPPYSIPLYGPVFYYAVAPLVRYWPSLVPGRSVSLASAVGIGLLSAWVLRRRYKASWQVAMLGAVPWLALRGPLEFAINNRVDTLALLFAVSSLSVAAVFARRGWVAAIPLLLLCGFTKATVALAPTISILAMLAWQGRYRSAALFGSLLAAGVLAVFAIGDAASAGNFSECLVGSVSELRPELAKNITMTLSKQALLPVGVLCGVVLCADRSRRLFGLHAVLAFVIAAATSAKVGANLNYFMEASWSAAFSLAVATGGQQHNRRGYPLMLALSAVLLGQSVWRDIPHLALHRERIAPWRDIAEAVEKYGRRGPLLTMHVGAQVLAGQTPYMADVFIATCLSQAGKFDTRRLEQDLRDRRFAAVIARDDIRPEVFMGVIWTDATRRLVARYYEPAERIAEWNVYIPRDEPLPYVSARLNDPRRGSRTETVFYGDGKTESQATYHRGAKHGTERFWDRNGRLWRQVNYHQGEAHGAETIWFADGRVAKIVHWRQGRRDGVTTCWYPSGKLASRTPYRADERHGCEVFWSEDGRTIRRIEWQHNSEVDRWELTPKPCA